MSKGKRKISRREVLAGAATAAAFTIVPRHVLGKGVTPPSDTFGAALIGTGGRGFGTYGGLARGHSIKLLAVCDIHKGRLAGAVNRARKKMNSPTCEGYVDFRRVLERTDIQMVAIATPPHWHALISIAAMEAGKDVICEKPMTRFIGEGRAVVEAQNRYKRVFQIGTFGRFGVAGSAKSREMHKILASGLLKKSPAVHIKKRGLKVKQWSGIVNPKGQPVPEQLEWDLYQGPSPMRPFHPHRHGGTHRGYWDYEGGGLADMGQHHFDPVQYRFAKDYTSPVRVTPYAPPAHPEATNLWGWVEMEYADGTIFVFESGEWGEPYDRRKPRDHVDLNDLDEEGRKKLAALPDPEPLLSFSQAVKQRKLAGGHAEASNRSATLLHLANIAIRTGRELRYDPVKEQIVGDDEANRLVNQPMRAPWHL